MFAYQGIFAYQGMFGYQGKGNICLSHLLSSPVRFPPTTTLAQMGGDENLLHIETHRFLGRGRMPLRGIGMVHLHLNVLFRKSVPISTLKTIIYASKSPYITLAERRGTRMWHLSNGCKVRIGSIHQGHCHWSSSIQCRFSMVAAGSDCKYCTGLLII